MAGDPVSDGEAPTVDLGGAESKDSFDDLLKRVVTGDQTPQLTPGTILSERFKIEKLIGAGGMGAVYVARDQTLGRDVAIKLHHTPGGGFRLRREAIAMAKLAHPNVVTVFEVGEVARFPFVVMEYVPGTTLRAWLTERPRSIPEIMEMLLAAGEGLAAAHDAGLLHRDIKPENVLIGSDGRARVGDFGLARELDSKDDPPPSDSVSGHMAPMTQTGAVLGTPAYMAPEQLAGKIIDARADQFAFCVTAWEALWRERPFRGATLDELLIALTTGKRSEPPATPKVPRQLRAALERGLSNDPEARFPSMRALLDALRAPLRRRRMRVLLGASALGLATLGLVGYFALRSEQVSCDNAAADVVGLLPRDIVVRLEALGAKDAARRVSQDLGHFAGSLEQGARRACEAEARHEWSPQLVAKSKACREVAARIARDMLRPAHLELENVPGIVLRASTGLPSLISCSSPAFLATSPTIPDDPAGLKELIDARINLSLATMELHEHRPDAAKPYLDRAEQSSLRESPLLKPELLVARGLAAYRVGDDKLAEKLTADGYYAARAIDDDTQTTTALNVLLELAAEKPPDDPMVATWLRTAAADADRMAARAPWLSASLFLVCANVADITDDGPAALGYVARAVSLVPDDTSIRARGLLIKADVEMWSGQVDQGKADYDKAIAMRIEQLGADHPRVGISLADYAGSLLEAQHVDDALEVARRAIAIIEKSTDPSDQAIDSARVNLAAVLTDAGLNEEARALFETARARYIKHHGVRSTVVANIDMNLAIIHMDANEIPKAVALLEESLATDEALLGKERMEVAEVLFNLAVARERNGDLPGAQAAARRCAEIYAAKRPNTARHALALALLAKMSNSRRDYAAVLAATEQALQMKLNNADVQTIAWPTLERARALIGLGRSKEAKPLLTTARAMYAAIPLPGRVDEIDRLLAQMR